MRPRRSWPAGTCDHADRAARLAPILKRLSAEERSTIAAALPALRRIAELGENEQRGRA
jgi:hypothetical protein